MDQSNIKTEYMRKRYSSLLESKKFSDCRFKINNEIVFAHKIILATASTVFEAMFFGPLATSDVEVKDIKPAEFKQMLNFIYRDEVQITSISNAWSLVYVAKKYLIDDLLDYSLDYIEKHLHIFDVLLSYEYSDLYCEKEMRNHCLDFIKMHAKLILRCDYHMKPSTLCDILDQEDFNADEEDIIKATVNWANVECAVKNVECTKDNIRSVLKSSGAMSKIRFLTLPLDGICLYLLNKDELISLQTCKFDNSVENRNKIMNLNLCLDFSPRCTVPLIHKLAFRDTLKIGAVYHANEYSKLTTQIKANKQVLISGFLLPTRRAPDCSLSHYEENLNIVVQDTNSTKTYQSKHSEKLMFGIMQTVKINEPILFEEGESYTVDISWSSSRLDWANEYNTYYLSPSFVHNNLNIEFSDPYNYGFIHGVCYYAV